MGEIGGGQEAEPGQCPPRGRARTVPRRGRGGEAVVDDRAGEAEAINAAHPSVKEVKTEAGNASGLRMEERMGEIGGGAGRLTPP